MLRWWRRSGRRVEPDAATFERNLERLPPLGCLSPADLSTLRDYTGRFLADKRFHGAHEFEITAEVRTTIAQLACWPVLALGYPWLGGWRDVIVYPGGFRARRTHDDDATGVVHEWDEDLAGESWDRGPLVLSWEDLRLDLEQPDDVQNVVVHEIAHKLDAREGEADGMPPLPRSIAAREWQQAFQQAFDELARIADEDESQAPIDPYAATAPEEFFAVTSEYHFLAPELLEAAYPQVAGLLRRFYAG